MYASPEHAKSPVWFFTMDYVFCHIDADWWMCVVYSFYSCEKTAMLTQTAEPAFSVIVFLKFYIWSGKKFSILYCSDWNNMGYLLRLLMFRKGFLENYKRLQRSGTWVFQAEFTYKCWLWMKVPEFMFVALLYFMSIDTHEVSHLFSSIIINHCHNSHSQSSAFIILTA